MSEGIDYWKEALEGSDALNAAVEGIDNRDIKMVHDAIHGNAMNRPSMERLIMYAYKKLGRMSTEYEHMSGVNIIHLFVFHTLWSRL